MPRVIEITVPPDQTAALLSEIDGLKEVIGVRVQKGIAITPSGDVVTVVMTDRALSTLFQLLDRLGMTCNPDCSITTARPMGLLSASSARLIQSDSSHFMAEEMDQEMNHASSMSFASMAAMAIAGAITVIGIETNALHLVIGAMVIAPGFEPISRVALGLVHRSTSWRAGIVDFAKAYLLLIAGAAVATLVMQYLAYLPRDTQASYLAKDSLISYWMSASAASYMVSVLAAAAGALLIIGQRSVLTAGVMIALALIPSASIFGMGMATLDGAMAWTGLKRFGIETFIVLFMSALVFWCNTTFIEKRRMTP